MSALIGALIRQKSGKDKSSLSGKQGSTQTCNLTPTFTDLGILALWDHATKTVLLFKLSLSPLRDFGGKPVSEQAYCTCFPYVISGVHLACIKQFSAVVNCLME